LDQLESKPKKKMSADRIAELKALKRDQEFEQAQEKKEQEEQHAAMMKTSTAAPPPPALGPMDPDLDGTGATSSGHPEVSFIQVESSSSSEPKSASLVENKAAEAKRQRRAELDGYLQKQQRSETNNDAVRHKALAGKIGFELHSGSAALLKYKAKRAKRFDANRKWIAEADPDYAGPGPDLMPVTGDEIKRVDARDHKLYTKRQYRMKHNKMKREDADREFARMPTERRVKNLGKKAFVRRFR